MQQSLCQRLDVLNLVMRAVETVLDDVGVAAQVSIGTSWWAQTPWMEEDMRHAGGVVFVVSLVACTVS
jgi:hypothetical protein